ncbi:hypothetical protein AZE42_00879 [Rhizopogon vesiculosus]|uniref:Uncharacterized protein n=1 Tax=Rhizopogon vesiculosus TaxID=180088 RepID=A0A1J8RAJ7_9AGAM|nr:hypothetical protein AZE42_00879 [Rhizopogon vesiculosus]
MAALPSFIELMASLGLDNVDAKQATPNIIRTRDRSSSCSSCSSMGSSADDGSPSVFCANLSTTRDIDSDRRPSRLRAVRYSPYISTSSTARQSSTASLTRSQSDHEQGSRSPSPNSNPPPSPLYNTRCPLSLHLPKRERPSITPISSYVRRKTPQNSPTVLTFAQREYVERPEVIIPPSLPTIPPVSR